MAVAAAAVAVAVVNKELGSYEMIMRAFSE